jgi:hypothetical protein
MGLISHAEWLDRFGDAADEEKDPAPPALTYRVGSAVAGGAGTLLRPWAAFVERRAATQRPRPAFLERRAQAREPRLGFSH